MNSYKILYIIRQAEFGGGETHLKYIFDSIDRKLFVPVLVSLSSGFLSDFAKSMGIKFYLLSKNKFSFIFNVFKLIKIIKQEKINFIHAHGTKGAALVLIPALMTRKKMIYTVHAWSFHPELNKWKYKFRKFIERIICSQTYKVILVSQTDFNSATFVDPRKKILIRNGVDTFKFYPNKDFELREKLGYQKNDFVIGYFTRFTHQKNPLFMIEVMKKLKTESNLKKKLKLLMIGDGESREKIVEEVQKDSLTEVVKILSPTFEIEKYLNVVDCYVLPSFWEGMPYGVLEAMSCGLPVIASNIPNINEIIKNEVNGFCENLEVENFAKRIIQLAEDKILYARISLNARSTIEQNFNIDKQLQELYKIYEKLKVNDRN
jgi:glycosyltransferase involved in cell wall biosynthesis